MAQIHGVGTPQLRVPSPGHGPRAALWGPPGPRPLPGAIPGRRRRWGSAAPALALAPWLWAALAHPAAPGAFLAERPLFVMAVSACPPVHPACPFLVRTGALGLQRGASPEHSPGNPHQRERVGAPPRAGAAPGGWGCPALPALCWHCRCPSKMLPLNQPRGDGLSQVCRALSPPVAPSMGGIEASHSRLGGIYLSWHGWESVTTLSMARRPLQEPLPWPGCRGHHTAPGAASASERERRITGIAKPRELRQQRACGEGTKALVERGGQVAAGPAPLRPIPARQQRARPCRTAGT